MIFVIFLYSLCFATVTAIAAKSRNRDPFSWFFIGLIFGLFGLIAVLVMAEGDEETESFVNPHSPINNLGQSAQTKKCPDCAEEIKFEAKVCRFCGKRFDETESSGLRKEEATQPVKKQSSVKAKGPRTERCKKCYTMNYDTDMFCSSCGKAL